MLSNPNGSVVPRGNSATAAAERRSKDSRDTPYDDYDAAGDGTANKSKDSRDTPYDDYDAAGDGTANNVNDGGASVLAAAADDTK